MRTRKQLKQICSPEKATPKGTLQRVPFFMRVLVCSIGMLLLVNTAVCASDVFDVQQVGSSARMIAMGNIEGFGLGAENMFENTAGLYRVKNYGMSAFTTKFMDEIEYKNVAGAMKIGHGVLGIGYMALGVGNIPKTKEEGDHFAVESVFEHSNSVVKAGYEQGINVFGKEMYVGTALDYYFTNMSTYTSNGVNVDCGVLMQCYASEISVNIKNILWFADERYSNGGKENLAMEWVGSVRVPYKDIRMMGQMRAIEDKHKVLKSFGVEYVPSLVKMVNVCAGYKEAFDAVERVKGTMTLGMGVTVHGVTAQYGYEQCEYRENESKHYFSVGFQY